MPVYLREGASLAKYKKVMLDPVEVSFDKNWDPKPTGSVASGSIRVDTQRIRTNLGEARAGGDQARAGTEKRLSRSSMRSATTCCAYGRRSSISTSTRRTR